MPGQLSREEVLAWLERRGTRTNVRGMARYGIVAGKAFGVSMGTMRPLARRIGTNHDLAIQLWQSGWHEARILAAMVGDPERVTRREMNSWAADFENWADCDTVCFRLWGWTPLAWEKPRLWAGARRELVKRAAFALMASLAVHDKSAPDRPFLLFLPLIEQGARDERHLVRKGVSWALRSIGKRNRTLHAAALILARRLAASKDAPPRWVGSDAARELASPAIQRKLEGRARQKGR